MDSYSSAREVEKAPTTRTERHTALYTETVRRIGRLKEQQSAVRTMFGQQTPLEYDLHATVDLLVKLSQELKPDTRDHG
jgi:hypothetical protein